MVKVEIEGGYYFFKLDNLLEQNNISKNKLMKETNTDFKVIQRITTGELTKMFCETWGCGLSWKAEDCGGPHEASFLKLNNRKIKEKFGWEPTWHISEAVKKVCEWNQVYISRVNDIPYEMDREIKSFLNDAK